jgi:two-component system, response regulator PdtaR
VSLSQTTRVVIAEDEAIIRLDLKEILEEEGYEVVGETGRGDAALDLIRNLRPDIAILDIKMPGMDGLAVANELQSDPICAVLLLTAFSGRDVVDQARAAGVHAYVVKPFQKSDLVPSIEMAIGRYLDLKNVADQRDLLEDQLESRKIVDRAKGFLIDNFGMSESDAFSFIQRTAMSGRERMSDVASRVLSGELRP